MDIPTRIDNVVLRTADLMRVANLRRRQWTPEAAEHLAVEMTKALRTPYGQMTLRPIQAVALYELATEGGLFAPMGTGQGKTLTSLLAPVILQRTRGVGNRPLLIVPAGLIEKTERDAKMLAEHWQLARFYKIMSYEFLGRVAAAANERTGYKGALEEFAPDFSFLDEAHRARNRRTAGVAKRLDRFFRTHQQVIVAAASGTFTNRSILDYAHILRWCHPPQHVPLPLHWNELEAWARALDERQTEPGEPGALEILCNAEEQALWRTDRHTAARLAYRRRLVDTPGVVATKDSSVGATLILRGVQPKLSKVIEEGFDILRTWETPDGWPIDDAISMARHARELAAGFYYMWWNEQGFHECLSKQKQKNRLTIAGIEWSVLNRFEPMIGNGIALARAVAILRKERLERGLTISRLGTDSQSRSISNDWMRQEVSANSAENEVSYLARGKGVDPSASIMTTKLVTFVGCSVDPAIEPSQLWVTILRESPALLSIFDEAVQAARPPYNWLSARKAWSKYVRETLKHSRTMDTELQVRQREHLKEKEKPGSMCEELVEWNKVKDTFEPNTVPVWVCNSVLEFAHDWAKKHRGIIWNEHVCFGERLEREGGIPYYGRKGRDARGHFIDDHPAEQSLIASVASNKEGRNLQKWSENLVLGWPSSGSICEQLIARTHRPGQDADEVTFEAVVSCIEHLGAFEQSRRDAAYIQASTGNEQKLNLATIDMPETLIGMGSRWTK